MEFQGKLVLVGPIPVVHDRPWLCRELKETRELFANALRSHNHFSVVDAADLLTDEWGVVPQLMDVHGLTWDGRQEFKQRLQCF